MFGLKFHDYLPKESNKGMNISLFCKKKSEIVNILQSHFFL